ncbi:AAA family ATPase [Streptomyces hiroshimensis]|uniref:ATPase AAA n=1 Tax=Streptomyces hiroshimensis TaxID=66424 RepID=A0ABQ2YSY5_9ACTN|nr:AAA family ATPase [Streptomyces hiroshimensis]GGX93560.1 ATPase AAA [Streptomyces hiroshimensis]
MTLPDDAPSLTSGEPGERPRWWIYRGTGERLHDTTLGELLPPPPPWRRFDGSPVLPPPPAGEEEDEEAVRRLGAHPSARRPSAFARREAEMVNAALVLRRPLLVSGRPGTGKSSLAYRISRELRLGPVLRWHITSRSTLQRGLYEYDAIGRVHDAAALRAATGDGVEAPTAPTSSVASTAPAGPAGAVAPAEASEERAAASPAVGNYIQLGPLGTALLPYAQPRVLLIDELDKSDLDLANDLLSVFEEGSFPIPELLRARRRHPSVKVMTYDPEGEAEITGGMVTCRAFPVIVITSNSEREFPPAFLRRCLVLDMPEPDENDLADMLAAHLGPEVAGQWGGELISRFADRRREGVLSIDQLLNAAYLTTSTRPAEDENGDLPRLVEALWHRLDGTGHVPGIR